MTIRELLHEASLLLLPHSNTARLDSELLFQKVIQKDKSWLIAHGEDSVAENITLEFKKLITRRLSGEPVAYILGRKEFYGRDFLVNATVLIPRPETELIVDQALTVSPTPRKILEVGIGSGCVIISILCELKQRGIIASGYGTDISDLAIEVAQENAKRFEVDSNLTFRKSDLFPETHGNFDLIVSNPPYIPIGSDEVSAGTAFEPKIALYSGDDGLDCIRAISLRLNDFLSPGGIFLMEFGIRQEQAIKDIFAKSEFKDIQIFPDHAGIPRVLKILKKS